MGPARPGFKLNRQESEYSPAKDSGGNKENESEGCPESPARVKEDHPGYSQGTQASQTPEGDDRAAGERWISPKDFKVKNPDAECE
jgi:hypothetical protein